MYAFNNFIASIVKGSAQQQQSHVSASLLYLFNVWNLCCGFSHSSTEIIFDYTKISLYRGKLIFTWSSSFLSQSFEGIYSSRVCLAVLRYYHTKKWLRTLLLVPQCILQGPGEPPSLHLARIHLSICFSRGTWYSTETEEIVEPSLQKYTVIMLSRYNRHQHASRIQQLAHLPYIAGCTGKQKAPMGSPWHGATLYHSFL